MGMLSARDEKALKQQRTRKASEKLDGRALTACKLQTERFTAAEFVGDFSVNFRVLLQLRRRDGRRAGENRSSSGVLRTRAQAERQVED